MGIQQSLLFSTTTFAHNTFSKPVFQTNPKPSKWPSSSLSSSPPWPLLPSPRVPPTRTPRSTLTPSPAPPSAATARTASASPSSPSPSNRLAVPTSLLAARPVTPRATPSTSRPTALPSRFKRDNSNTSCDFLTTFQHLQSGKDGFRRLESSSIVGFDWFHGTIPGGIWIEMAYLSYYL